MLYTTWFTHGFSVTVNQQSLLPFICLCDDNQTLRCLGYISFYIHHTIYSALSIYRGHFSSYNSRTMRWRWRVQIWPMPCHCNCCVVGIIISYITAIYGESIVLLVDHASVRFWRGHDQRCNAICLRVAWKKHHGIIVRFYPLVL